MKTLYKCEKCSQYSLKSGQCKNCNGLLKHPYPAKFSLIKEKRYRKMMSKSI